jgi:hypothetical protein
MAPGRPLHPITNGLHQDHRGIRRVREDGPSRPLPLVFTTDPIASPPHPSYARAGAWLAALLVLAGAALGASPTARADATVATVVCWKQLLNDWYDGRIDRAYPVRCYRDAIANLPDDVKVYADAEADIRRALLAAIRQTKKTTGKEPTAQTPVKPPAKPRPKPPASKPGKTDTGKTETQPPGAVSGGPDPGDPFANGALPSSSTRSADSVPLPLIVLGALALLLLAAAGAGLASKRLQARRLTMSPPPSEEPPPVA